MGQRKQIGSAKSSSINVINCYISALAALSPSEMSDARISWTKSGLLSTLIDDLFDVAGSREELVNLMQLVDQ